MDHMEHELKKEFQLERMILFSDAVFAIAITLLILEIKIPDLKENISDKALLHALGDLAPKFLGFIISFWIIGLYWTIHHAIFGFVVNYDRKLLWLNLAFLLTIVIMPFSTGFYSNYSGSVLFEKELKVPMVFYVLNLCATGIFNYLLWNYVSNPKHKLALKIPGGGFIQLAKARSLIVPLAFLLMLPVSYLFSVKYAVYLPALIPFYMSMAKKFIDKKYKKKTHPVHHN